MLSRMTWFRKPPGWRDAECASAALVTGVAALAAAMTRLPACCAPRCLLKTWTGVPCLTCGGIRALNALLTGHVAAAFRLQPLLTLLAIAAMAWVGYAVAGALFGVCRLRVRTTRREQRVLMAAAVVLVLANWVYLIADGR
jgi:hypothetical protein